MSGQLKEAYGGVSQELSVLKKEIGPDASLATPEQSAKQSDLVTCLSQIEGMLTTVNTANEELWPEIRTKAELVRTKAISLGGMAK